MKLKYWLKQFQSNAAITTNLDKAIQYLLKTEYLKVKNLTHIAKKLDVSPSLLSQYQSGKKQISEVFIKKFEDTFSMDLYNPLTFIMEDWIDVYHIDDNTPDIPAKTYLNTYAHMRNRMKVQEGIILNLRNLNSELTKANILMTDVLVRVEPICLNYVLNNKTGEKL